MAERNGVDQAGIVIGAVVVSKGRRRTIIRRYRSSGCLRFDLAARVHSEYDVISMTLDELQEGLRRGDRIEPPRETLLPDVPDQQDVSDRVRRLLIEAAVRAIGSALFVRGQLACEILDVCWNRTESGMEPRIIISCQPTDFSAPVGMLLGACGEAGEQDSIESLSVNDWIKLMVATDWMMLPISPGSAAPLSEDEAQQYLRELIGEEFADGEIEA